MKGFKLAASIAMIVLCASFPASAKKMTVMNVEKGDIFNDSFGCECSMSEENAEKKGSMVIKVDVTGDKGGFWCGVIPKKLFVGYDTLKFYAFNPGKTPLALSLTIKFGSSSCKYEDRFDQNFMLKPGKNEVEIELAGSCTNGGAPCDWKLKPFWYFSGPTEKYTFYVGSITLETEESEKTDEKAKK